MKIITLDNIHEYTYGLVQEIGPLAPLSQGRHKLIMQTVLNKLKQKELHFPLANFGSEEFQEGLSAFIERRELSFKRG